MRCGVSKQVVAVKQVQDDSVERKDVMVERSLIIPGRIAEFASSIAVACKSFERDVDRETRGHRVGQMRKVPERRTRVRAGFDYRNLDRG